MSAMGVGVKPDAGKQTGFVTFNGTAGAEGGKKEGKEGKDGKKFGF